MNKQKNLTPGMEPGKKGNYKNAVNNIIDPEKDIVKQIFTSPLSARFGQVCSLCGFWFPIREITIKPNSYSWVCFSCLEGMEELEKKTFRKGEAI